MRIPPIVRGLDLLTDGKTDEVELELLSNQLAVRFLNSLNIQYRCNLFFNGITETRDREDGFNTG